jgi:hypothetical protein
MGRITDITGRTAGIFSSGESGTEGITGIITSWATASVAAGFRAVRPEATAPVMEAMEDPAVTGARRVTHLG